MKEDVMWEGGVRGKRKENLTQVINLKSLLLDEVSK